jgi:hypothetical protein
MKTVSITEKRAGNIYRNRKYLYRNRLYLYRDINHNSLCGFRLFCGGFRLFRGILRLVGCELHIIYRAIYLYRGRVCLDIDIFYLYRYISPICNGINNV